jgi:ADP-heptose:LPS heptosyltransferase
MKLLCICPIGIGNYLLCYPAWSKLRKYRPEAELHLLALRKPILDLANGDPLWNRIHCIDPTRRQGLRKTVSFIMQLRAEHFDVSLSYFPSNTWQYNLLPFLAGIKKRIAFRYHLKAAATLSPLNTSHLPVEPALHDVLQNLMLTTHFLGHPPTNEPVVFPVLFTDDQLRRTREELRQGSGRYIAVHPGSSAEHGMDAKRWPAERFGALADRTAALLGAQTLIVGGPDELALKKETAAAMKQPCRVIEPGSLAHTAALLKQCTLCLCNDSGIMHLAACSGIPTAAFFGPTDERRNGPYGADHCIIRKKGTQPLWTAANVGKRVVPAGSDPRQSLLDLSVDEAWEQLVPFLQRFSS